MGAAFDVPFDLTRPGAEPLNRPATAELQVHGSADLLRTLLRQGLIDERRRRLADN